MSIVVSANGEINVISFVLMVYLKSRSRKNLVNAALGWY